MTVRQILLLVLALPVLLPAVCGYAFALVVGRIFHGSSGKDSAVTFFNRPFWPSDEATAVLLTRLAFRLSKQVKVRVCCSTLGPTTYPFSGVVVSRWPVRWDFLRRFGKPLEYVHAFLTMAIEILTLPRQSLAVIWTDPPFLDTWLGLICRPLGLRYAVVIQDWYPENLIRLGLLPFGPVRRLASALQLYSLKGAHSVVCISQDMTEEFLRMGVSRATTIENWAVDAPSSLSTLIAEQRLARSEAWDETPYRDRLIVKFAGNFGIGCDVDVIERTLPLLARPDDFLFVFQGRGRQQGRLESLAARHTNVQIQAWVTKGESGRSTLAADVHLITLPPSLAGVALPSKTYGILAAGMPVLVTAKPASDLHRLTQSVGCGLAVDATDPKALALTLEELSRIKREDPAVLARLGSAGHHYATAVWHEDAAITRYLELWRPPKSEQSTSTWR